MADLTDRTAAEYFGQMRETYDSLIHRCVPRYEEMLERILEYAPLEAHRVLELGCGTGNLTAALAARYPEAEIVIVDASPEMLEFTTQRLPNTRLRQISGTFETIADMVNGPFDLITSCASLHHVIDKGALYHSLATLLRQDGRFSFGDQMYGGSEFNQDRNMVRFFEFCRQPGNCSEDEIQGLIDHAAAHDHYTPLAEHFTLLAKHGFRELDCVWRNFIWGVITATR